jgi:hypothetical protein
MCHHGMQRYQACGQRRQPPDMEDSDEHSIYLSIYLHLYLYIYLSISIYGSTALCWALACFSDSWTLNTDEHCILNKNFWTTDKEWSSRFMTGRESKNRSPKYYYVTKCCFTESWACVSSVECHKQRKMDALERWSELEEVLGTYRPRWTSKK